MRPCFRYWGRRGRWGGQFCCRICKKLVQIRLKGQVQLGMGLGSRSGGGLLSGCRMGASALQDLNYCRVAAFLCNLQGCLALPVDCLRVCASGKQGFSHFRIPVPCCCLHQGSPACAVSGLNIRASGKQGLDLFNIFRCARCFQQTGCRLCWREGRVRRGRRGVPGFRFPDFRF